MGQEFEPYSVPGVRTVKHAAPPCQRRQHMWERGGDIRSQTRCFSMSAAFATSFDLVPRAALAALLQICLAWRAQVLQFLSVYLRRRRNKAAATCMLKGFKPRASSSGRPETRHLLHCIVLMGCLMLRGLFHTQSD